MSGSTQGLRDVPASIERVVAFARETLHPKKIVLFGSRAAGTGRDFSDFDLAFVLDDESRPRWARFAAEVHEEPITLYELDLVNWDEASDELREAILREGVTLYER